MTDDDTLSARIDALEMRLTEQDMVIDDLNATITAQWRQIDALTRHLAKLVEQVEEAGARTGTGAPEPPPPHY
ncbi:SlyX family protein [Methylobacterium sp. SD274]|uniref:SlyX family protein n=1 Tax=Methylobacterium sp. SD274 TaxID=2782009 RepID=UPI001A97852B|nr:SlyX family protein [Methylobacterium sp. SD274]MBO1022361.1 SlyX family protein [Methylobacterium sp. SD274]